MANVLLNSLMVCRTFYEMPVVNLGLLPREVALLKDLLELSEVRLEYGVPGVLGLPGIMRILQACRSSLKESFQCELFCYKQRAIVIDFCVLHSTFTAWQLATY